jgi:hypothetical protein
MERVNTYALEEIMIYVTSNKQLMAGMATSEWV